MNFRRDKFVARSVGEGGTVIYADITDHISHRIPSPTDRVTNKLIPSILGRKVNEIERRLLALPVHLGGLGIENPVLW